jgi:hypothetical protein
LKPPKKSKLPENIKERKELVDVLVEERDRKSNLKKAIIENEEG